MGGVEETLNDIKNFNLDMPFKFRNFQAAFESLAGVAWQSVKGELALKKENDYRPSRVLREARRYYKDVIKKDGSN